MSVEYTVQRLRGGYALVYKEDGIRRRRTLYSKDRSSAEAEARRVWQEGDGSPWHVGKLMDGYMASITEKPSHQRRKDAWKAMRSFWERADPDLIDEQMCRDYDLQRRAGPATVRYELLQISTALKWGRSNRHISAKPEMWLPEAPERKVRHLDHNEFELFFAQVKAPHARLYVLLGLYTMARPAAILDLTWDRVDFSRRLIDLNPAGRKQTAKRRPTIPIANDLLEPLTTAYEARQSSFVIEHGAKQVASVKKAFGAASSRSGVSVTPYTLRHTGAVWAAEAGVPMSEIAQYMGHDDDRTTQKHYSRFSPGYLAGVANAIRRSAA